MIKRLGPLVAVVLLLGVLIPAPASAHTASWIGTDLNVIYRYRTRGGTGFAVSGTLEIVNKKASTRTIECTLKAVYREKLRYERVPAGATKSSSFFMSTRRMSQNPKIVHCHRAPSADPIGLNRRI